MQDRESSRAKTKVRVSLFDFRFLQDTTRVREAGKALNKKKDWFERLAKRFGSKKRESELKRPMAILKKKRKTRNAAG